MPAASTRPNTSGCSVSSLAMTSSFTQSVPNTSRAICAVVTASLTVRQPAVLGSTRTPSDRDELQEALARAPARLLAAQRDGDELRARGLDRTREHVRRGILRGAEQQPRGELHAVERERALGLGRWFDRVHARISSLAAVARRDDLDPVAGLAAASRPAPLRHEIAVARRRNARARIARARRAARPASRRASPAARR